MATMASIVGAKSNSLMPVMAILEHDDPLFRDTPSSTTALESQKNFSFSGQDSQRTSRTIKVQWDLGLEHMGPTET